MAEKLVDAVRPGGSLLVVAHAPDGVRAHGFDPADYVQPDDIATLLESRPADGESREGGWEIVTHETRPRGIPAGGGHHIDDVVLLARRLPAR